MSEDKVELSKAVREKIDQWVTRYPKEQKRSGVMEALRFVQEEQGWLSEAYMNAVADYLEMPQVAVYEVATFYTFYHLKPTGRHVINVCTNISCMLCGSEKVVVHLKNKLGIDLNEITADGKFILKEVECLGACAGAPMMQVGKKYHEHLTPDKIDAILAELE